MTKPFSPSSSQLGTVAEQLAAMQLMMASDGRLSPYRPMVDGDGYDILFLDRETGKSLPVQIKSWSKPASDGRRPTIQFDLRRSAYREEGHVLAVHFDPVTTAVLSAWLIPMKALPQVATLTKSKYAMSPSTAPHSRDRYAPYRCGTLAEVARRLIGDGDEPEPMAVPAS